MLLCTQHHPHAVTSPIQHSCKLFSGRGVNKASTQENKTKYAHLMNEHTGAETFSGRNSEFGSKDVDAGATQPL